MDDEAEMIYDFPRHLPLCSWCKHYDIDADENREPRIARCAAFPDEIPRAILEFKFDHRMPYEGDKGIQFEKIEDPAKLPKFVHLYKYRSDEHLILVMSMLRWLRMSGKALPPLSLDELASDEKSYDELLGEAENRVIRRYFIEILTSPFWWVLRLFGIHRL